ncbi:carbohydrate ABC transporter permease [Tessaracoccus oleiagri]|uniref:Carbohydrate ABC transporter membrane protein 2, CUT1 family (TC 3.A.1.1.-) n=1 Tax=Tessaracoccus oleiagri TaxID=686624 RepID=A0A1G9JL63_9ACTN|nr:carbohydrate ABC transporter permease [Tessaracoccus oleiagri]SDL37834.1 carbohydrate ABC transporter membrane protein 2, CUT1 family (TC 3.A.1.1.-) [Tessaracoccus oleiagri]
MTTTATNQSEITAAVRAPGTPAPAPRRRGPEGWRLREWLFEGIRWIILLALAALFMYPLLWLVSASLKPRGEVFDNRLIPKTFTPENYVEVWDRLPLLSWLGNSIFIAVAAALLMTLASSAVAFGFAYFRFPGKNILFGIVLATMMLPGAVTLIPNYLIWKYLGFLGTHVPLWGGALFGSAFYIFLMRQFYMGVPRELFEAARVDGCGYFGLFTRIAFPLTLPSAIIVFLFEFQAAWNNFTGALIYLNFGDVEDYTVPLGINYAMTQFSPTAGGEGDYQYVMVAALVVTLPMLLLFAFGQRYFIQGLSSGGLKG